ncbi:MAG TPA: GtrA family protein [Ktedonobacterales bacterium]
MKSRGPLAARLHDNSGLDRKSSEHVDHSPQPEHACSGDQAARQPLTRLLSLVGVHVEAVWLRRLGKFLVVGGTGLGVNSAALFLLYQMLSLPLVLASGLATELSIVSNFCLNDRWTFGCRWPTWGRFFKFNLVALGGLVLATLTLWSLVTLLRMPYLFANLLGVLLATSWNFVVNVFWTWGGVSCL